MFSLSFYIGLILIGIFVGFVSGLLGVGGGFLMVPLQYFLFTSAGIDSTLAMVVSVATSLAIIIPTASSGAYRHQKVNKSIVKPGISLGIFGIIGSFCGGLVAVYIPVFALKVIFAILLIGIALNMVRESLKEESEEEDSEKNAKLSFNIITLACVGLAVGLLSGLLGIGGGIFIIPILTILFGFKLTKAIGTSSVYISLTAIGGVISYIISGWGVNPLPLSLGYISILNWILIVIFSVPMASLGAKYAYKVPEKKLRIIFAILMIFIAVKMLGILPF